MHFLGKEKEHNNKNKKSSSPRTRRGKLISAGYLFPSALGVLLFFVLPFMIVIFYSVVDNPISRQFVFFDNFVSVFRNNAFKQAAKNTMTFSVVAVPLAVVLSLMLAMMLESKIPFRSQFRTFFLSPI